MSYGGFTSKGPTYEYPLIESNAERCVRPVVVKHRKVKGKRGWLIRRIGPHFGAVNTPEGLGHAALLVGDYLHELHTDEANQKYLVAQRLTGEQIWPSTVGEHIRGYTTMTDQEIADTAMRVQSWMRSRQRGRYHVKKNNCHNFVEELLNRVAIDDKIVHDNASFQSSAWTGSTATLRTNLDEKIEHDLVNVAEVTPTPVVEKRSPL